MADPLAEPSDLASYWRPLTEQEQSVAESLLEVASAIIRRRYLGIDARIDDGSLDASIVRYVVCEMVKVAVEADGRPVGAKSVSDTVGPYTRAVTFDAASRLALTDDLGGLLAGDVTGTDTLGSLQLGLPQHHHHRVPCWPRW